MYEKYLEPVIEDFTTGEYYREVYLAKQEYFNKAGVVYEDDTEFEQRMCIFMDWYLYDRDLPGVDLPPIKYFFRRNKENFTSEELNIYRDFCSTVHSIFRMKRKSLNKNYLIIQDLFSKKNYSVSAKQLYTGFTRGDIFEARLILFQDTYYFSKGFCFHPQEIESFLLDEVKKIRFHPKNRQTKLVLQLSGMKLRHMRFPHIDIRQIYQFDSRL